MKHLFLVMIVGVLVGCGKKDSVQPNMPNPKASQPTTPNSYTANTNTTKPEPAKSKENVGGKLWEFETGFVVRPSPTIGSDGTVYVGSDNNKLYAINGKTGVKLWEFETGNIVSSSPAIGSDGTVYVGSGDKKLYAINGKTGVKLWEFETGFLVSSSPAIGSDGTVYVGSFDNNLYAIKTDSKGPAKSPWPMRGQNAQHTGRVMK